jgi:hypothetical protein
MTIGRPASNAGDDAGAGIGSAGVQLATLPNFVYPTDVESSSRWYTDDLIVPPSRSMGKGSSVPGKSW